MSPRGFVDKINKTRIYVFDVDVRTLRHIRQHKFSAGKKS